MMRRLMILGLTIAGCSGGGDSTTAAETVAETSSTGPSDTTPPDDTGPGDTGTSTTSPGTTELATGDSGDTDSADTSAGDTMAETTSGECLEVGIEGEWLSEGDNVAPLLVSVLDLVSVQAIFDETTFEVNSTDADGAMGQQLGTYQVQPCPGSDTKFSILLEQTSPSAITVEGIYEIDGCQDPAVMRYEVIQTQPDLGAVAPTCDDEFGAGQFGADNIQVFVRQP